MDAMLFDFDLTIPADTAELAPVVSRTHLIAGTLTQIRVVFPPGPATLVHVVVRDNLFQLMPANPEGSLNFDDEFIVSTMEYDLSESPYDVYLIGWSPGANFDHTITFQFELQPLAGGTWDTFVTQLFGGSIPRPGRR